MQSIESVSVRLVKQDWIDAATDTLKEFGVDRVKVDPIAKMLNVTRGSFYWHFNKRQDLLDAVLSNWQQKTTLDVIDKLEYSDIPARARLEKLLTLSFTTGPASLATEQGIRAWGLNDPEANKVIESVDDQRIEYLHQLILGMGREEFVAMQHARVIYFTRVGLYAQAAVLPLEERLLVIQSLLKMVDV